MSKDQDLSELVGKTILAARMTDASESYDGECYGTITLEFDDGTDFVIEEGGQVGYMKFAFGKTELTEQEVAKALGDIAKEMTIGEHKF